MYILGLSAFYHDSAACLLQDGRIIAAAQEERFTRTKHDARFPDQAIAYCLAEAGIIPEQIDQVVFYEKPFLKFERLRGNVLGLCPARLSQLRFIHAGLDQRQAFSKIGPHTGALKRPRRDHRLAISALVFTTPPVPRR